MRVLEDMQNIRNQKQSISEISAKQKPRRKSVREARGVGNVLVNVLRAVPLPRGQGAKKEKFLLVITCQRWALLLVSGEWALQFTRQLFIRKRHLT